jgi:hypothetical protein
MGATRKERILKMANKINDFMIGNASRPERLRYKGDTRSSLDWMAEKLQIDPTRIHRELKPDIPKGNSRVFKVRGTHTRHK